MYYRQSSLKSDRSVDILNKLWRLRPGGNNDALKGALYNFFIVAGLAAFGCVCIILGPFVRPLLWAFLMGAVLFPFKRKLAFLLNEWFEGLERRDVNVFLAIGLSPLQTAESCGKFLVDWVQAHWQILLGGISILSISKLAWLYAPKGVLCWIWRTIMFGHSVFSASMNLINLYLLLALLAVYITSVYFLWSTETSKYFFILGQSLWIYMVGYICSFLGAFQVPVFLGVMIYVIVAICFYLRNETNSSNGHNIVQNFTKLLDRQTFHKAVENIYRTKGTELERPLENPDGEEVAEVGVEKSGNTDTFPLPPVANASPTAPEPEIIQQNLSDFYFKLLFYACIGTFLYRNIWVFIILAIPMSVHLFWKLGDCTGFWTFLYNNIILCYEQLKNWVLDHHSALLPICLPGLLEINYKIQTFIRSSLKSSVDLVTSILMIILMILIIVFVGCFICVNIYSETIEVAYLGKDLINKTITDRPELIDIIPENFQSSIDDALDNAHHYGRRRIEQYIHDLLKDADPEHGNKLKTQILNVWDRLIQYGIDMNKSDTYGPRVPTDALKSTFGEIVDNPGHFKELVLVAKQGIIGWAKSNTNTILEVAESLWAIIRTNISLIMGFTGEIFSLVMSGGQAFIEFLLDMIVFFTALFYLLSSSNEKYAPLAATSYLGISSGTKIADALEISISGVLIAMFKTAVFQGLFTWLLHTIFGARIVFLPSALAAFLSAAPFLGSYWCALPAFLELWLAQDRFYLGVILFLLMFFVLPYVDTEIHAEMKGAGHPYLTALAIAGGMYWLGWQGAIFGPLMLCFFIGIFEVASVALRDSEEQQNKGTPDDDVKTRRFSTFENTI